MKTLRFHCFAPFKLLSHWTRRENMRNNVLLSTVESSCSSRRFNNCTASDKQCNVLGLKESIKGRLTLSTGHSRSQSQLLLNRSISCVKFPKIRSLWLAKTSTVRNSESRNSTTRISLGKRLLWRIHPFGFILYFQVFSTQKNLKGNSPW